MAQTVEELETVRDADHETAGFAAHTRGQPAAVPMPDPADPMDPRSFRSLMGTFPTGVTVVAALLDGRPVGVSANAFASVSLDPPLVLVCGGRTSDTWPLIRQAGSFTVNVLADDQEELCRRFATKGADRFTGVPYRLGATGNPILHEAAISCIEGAIVQVLHGGDHDVFLARVVALHRLRHAAPLIFHRGRYHTLTA